VRPSMAWKRVAKVAAWTFGVVVLLIGGAATAVYFFLTSSDFRSRVESEASAYSGRKTKIDKITIAWGTTAHVHLAGFEVANADWAKTPQMLKADEVDFDLRLWPLLKGDIVLPTLVLVRPQVAVEVGPQEQLNWSFAEAPVATVAAKAAAPKNRWQTP